MTEIERLEIVRRFQGGASFRGIAPALRIDRKTVASVIHAYQQHRESSDLLNRLVYELRIEEDFAAVIADATEIPMRRYPQAVAIAIALRHSWRPDLFASISRELRRISRQQHHRSSRGDPKRSAKPSHLSRRTRR
jgi:hypothetical protein